MDFVKPYKGVRYAGTYNNDREGCAMVSIRHSQGGAEDLKTAISEFSVCSGHVAAAGETVIKESVGSKRVSLIPGNAVMVTIKADNR